MSQAPHNPPADWVLSEVERLQGQIDALTQELRAQESRAALGLMSRWIAHEVANRLTPIAGYAAAALRHPEDRSLTERALRQTVLGCERLSQFSRLILQLADEGGNSAESCSDVRQAWEVVAELVSAQARASRIELVCHCADGLTVSVAPSVLEHILLNLALNAIRACRDGGVVELEAAPCSTGNTSMIELCVTDTGQGIDEGVVHRVLDAGFSASGSHGLGLSLVRHLVDAVGGSLAILSSPKEGTTVVVRLPAEVSQQPKQIAN